MPMVRDLALFRARSWMAVALFSAGLALAGISVGANPTRRVAPAAAAGPSSTAATGAWNIVSSPNSRPTPTDNFPAEVVCVSASDCWAVGYYNNVSAYQTLIHHWDGNSWTIVNSPNTGATQHN